jgi:hypothetical protein
MNDFNALVEAEIDRHARQWEKSEERLQQQIDKQQDHIRELELMAACVESDVPWFIKDFNVLYRTAKALVDPAPGKAHDPSACLVELQRQLDRLAPAFGHTEEVRKARR